ncbi:MAG: hypothetical protein J6G98_02970 [Bacilli bacterium]|nr:hypothetical protein [Bacilli bacterium]
MAKCRIDYKINNEHFKTIGIFKSNRLTFMENDIKFSITINDNSLELRRENDEYKLKIILADKSSCIYELKNINVGKLNIEVLKKSLEIKNNYIKAKYKLDDALFDLELTYEVIE